MGISPNLQLSAVGNKDELIWFWGQKVKGQDRSETNHADKRHLGNVEGHELLDHSLFGEGIAYRSTVHCQGSSSFIVQ